MKQIQLMYNNKIYKIIILSITFFSLLNDLLDDQNFKIITVTLDIIASMIDTETLDLRPFLKQLVYAVTKRMDDSKTVVRQSIMKVY